MTNGEFYSLIAELRSKGKGVLRFRFEQEVNRANMEMRSREHWEWLEGRIRADLPSDHEDGKVPHEELEERAELEASLMAKIKTRRNLKACEACGNAVRRLHWGLCFDCYVAEAKRQGMIPA